MKALSVRQPWPWLMFNADPPKDIENRTWPTDYRGPVLIHAGKARDAAFQRCPGLFVSDLQWDMEQKFNLLEMWNAPRGGIVGQVTIVDCVWEHPSLWKQNGSWGFVLSEPKLLEFRPCRGALRFFAPEEEE